MLSENKFQTTYLSVQMIPGLTQLILTSDSIHSEHNVATKRLKMESYQILF